MLIFRIYANLGVSIHCFFFSFYAISQICIKTGGWKHLIAMHCNCNNIVLLTLMPHFNQWFIIEMFKIVIFFVTRTSHLTSEDIDSSTGLTMDFRCVCFAWFLKHQLWSSCTIALYGLTKMDIFFVEIFVHMKKVSHIHLGQQESE